MTKHKRIAIDFEFRDHKQAMMSLVAVSAQVEGEEPMSRWLYQDEVAQADFKLWVRHYQERYPDAIWLAYGATAEAECFLTLGIDPREFRWHDLHTDFIQAQNGSPTYCHGLFWAQRRIKVKTCCDEERCDCTDKQMKSVGKATWQKQFSVPVIVNTKMEWEDERGAGTYVDWVSESRWQGVRFPTRTVVFDRSASFEERKKQENKAFEACAAHIKNLGLSSEEIKPNLLNATLRLCGIERDPRAKDEARDIILGKRTYSAEDIRVIMEYAEDDTADLFAMDDKLQRILEAQSKQTADWVLAARAWRGRAAANHAHLVRRGLRLHKTRLENLRRNKQKVFERAYLRWNATVQPMFTWKNKERRWGSSTHAKNAFLKRICLENGIDDWERTARNDYSTSTKAGEALDRYADLVHQWRGAECEYDADGPLKGFQRFGKMQSSLNSIPELERDHGAEAEVGNDGYDDDVTMLSFLGDDLHLRPYFGLYGTQTGRNAPKATGFLPAKAAWLRALIDPEPGYAYVELDYSSQETFIAGAISGDAGILRAYDKNGPTKGDPYLAFAIDAELITQAQYDDYKNDGPDAKHVKYIRKLCKVIVLGSQFGMGAKKLAIALRSATRDMSLTDEYAKELLALHARAYATYYKWKEQQAHLYFDRKLPMILPCGWYLAAGRRERDKLSVLNFPVQGRGSSIMRLALDKLLEAGIEVIAPVHDAFIFRAKIDELDRICEIAKRCMIEAADEVLGLQGMRVGDPEIVRHGEVWITEKGERDYETYKWAFEEPTERTIDVPMGDPLDEEF